MSLKCLITGGGGMLGRDIRSVFPESVALTHDELDITDECAVLDAARNKDLLINCAAYTQVDAAESNAAKAYAVNEAGARAVAKAAARRSIRVVHISTDYVFQERQYVHTQKTTRILPFRSTEDLRLPGKRLCWRNIPKEALSSVLLGSMDNTAITS